MGIFVGSVDGRGVGFDDGFIVGSTDGGMEGE